MNRVMMYTTTFEKEGIKETTYETGLIPDSKEQEMFVVNLYPQKKYQTIEGFGAALTESAGYTLARMSKEKQQEVLEAYYGKSGIGYTLGRIHMDSCDFSINNYCAVEQPNDSEFKDFNLERDEKYVQPLIKMADQALGKHVCLLLSPWSPPAFMKDTGVRNGGGHLKKECYQAYADYVVKYISEYQKRGITIDYMTVQNEPLAVQTWDSCEYTAKEEKAFLRDYLYPSLKANGLDLVCGNVVPSGKLTDSWPCSYSDYPNASVFSHNNGNVEKEKYVEGIYVGYRYFDTFNIPVRYCFGYGLSYTNFAIETMAVTLGTQEPEIGVKVKITNVGAHYTGREVVQLYVSCPQDKIDKEYRRLVGFYKTKPLAPGESEEKTIRFAISAMASYHENRTAWLLEEGCYGIFVGNSLATSVFSASIQVEGDAVLMETEHICPLQEHLEELKGNVDEINARRNSWLKTVQEKLSLTIHNVEIKKKDISYERNFCDFSEEVAAFVDKLEIDQLIELATGDISKAQGSNIGAAGNSVPGSAAETSGCAIKQGLAGIVLADGPAGLRLNKTYQAVDGKPMSMPFAMAIEDGFFARGAFDKKGETYYQYCTAIPVGTVLAQTWDIEIIKECGKAVAQEMDEFGVTLWLAPGMNIHRNPLCGRNFEYYSEDPLLSGIMAAAMTEGVQSCKGCGTTIKHFACNNQEDNRMHSNSIVSERALREIYLKGFEIAVTKSQPMAIMTSYNLINGVHAANSYDLCTKAARNEWGYQGLIMTDWTTTHNGPECTASGCMRAGNDIVMPGCNNDHENLKKELDDGTLDIRELKLAVGHLVNIIWQSNQYTTE